MVNRKALASDRPSLDITNSRLPGSLCSSSCNFVDRPFSLAKANDPRSNTKSDQRVSNDKLNLSFHRRRSAGTDSPAPPQGFIFISFIGDFIGSAGGVMPP